MSPMDRLAKRLADLEETVRSMRTPQLANSSVEDGALRVNASEQTVMQIGQQYDGTYTAATLTGPTPPTPSNPVLTNFAGGIGVQWDGLFAADGAVAVAPMDFAGVDVVVTANSTDDPIATPPTTRLSSPRGGSAFLALAAGTYWVWLVTRTTAGKASVPSNPVQGQSLDLGSSPTSDGIVPGAVSTVVTLSGVGSIFVKWSAVTTNANGAPQSGPVRYKVYAGTAVDFVADESSLLIESLGTMITTKALPDGTPFQYVDVDGITPIPYYFRVSAVDDDGEGVISAAVSGTMVQATSADIAVGGVTANNLAANSVTAASLDSIIALVSTVLSVGGTLDDQDNLTGQRVDLNPSDGVVATDVSGITTFRISNSGLPHFLSGTADIDYLRTLTGASFSGTVEVPQGSTMTLSSGTTPPTVPPTITSSNGEYAALEAGNPVPVHTGALGTWPTKFYGSEAQAGQVWGAGGYVDETEGAAYVVTWLYAKANYTWDDFLGSRVTKYTFTPGENGSANGTFVSVTDYPGEYIIRYIERAGVVRARLRRLQSNDRTTLALVSSDNNGGSEVTRGWTRTDTSVDPGLGWDHVNNKILLVEWSASGTGTRQRKVWRLGVNGSAGDGASWTSGNVTRAATESIASAQFGPFDFGSNKYVFSNDGSGSDMIEVHSSASGSTSDPALKFSTPQKGNICWDGQVFRVIPRNGYRGFIFRHSTSTDAVSNTPAGTFPWWVSSTYVRVDTTTGLQQYETPLGSKTRVTAWKRGFIWLTTPALPPSSTTTTGPNRYQVYTSKETVSNTAPANSTFRSDGVYLEKYKSLHILKTTTGTAPPSANSFPAASATSVLQSGALNTSGLPLWFLHGDGAWSLGKLSGDATTGPGTYQSYTPTLTGTGGNPTIGSGGTATGHWTRIGDMIHARAQIVFGTNPSIGSGGYLVSLPVPAFSTTGPIGDGRVRDDSAGTDGGRTAILNGNQAVQLNDAGNTRVNSGTQPWAVGDIIDVNVVYRAA